MADKKVVVYSTPTCPFYVRAKEYLSQKGIAYEEHDVAAALLSSTSILQTGSIAMTTPPLVNPVI